MHCIKCSGPMTGGGVGLKCNTCRTIEAIENKSQSSGSSDSSSGSSYGSGGASYGARGCITDVVGTIIFLLIDGLFFNFFITKVTWLLLAVGFYFMGGFLFIDDLNSILL